MQDKPFGKLVIAGFIATIVMSIVQAIAPMMGMPPMNIAAMVGSMFGGSTVVGWIAHLMMGAIVWPLVYAYLVESRLTGAPWLRGLEYGLILAIFVLVIGFPLVGAMFSSLTPKPGFLALGMGGVMGMMGVLIGHLIYGAVFGAVYGQQATPQVSPAAR